MSRRAHPREGDSLIREERWQEFYALASAMAQGRALKEIPLMYKVASQTVSAWEHRLDG
jgi:hypothetical protein